MRLKYDPFQYFRDKWTPCAIHIRRSVLGESTPELEEARREHLRCLYASQAEDGSWNGSVVDTIEALTVLYLCEIDISLTAERAIDFLLEKHLDDAALKKGRYPGLFSRMTPEDRKALTERQDLIVHKGNGAFAKTAAALFLSSFFNREGDPRVVGAFRSLDAIFDEEAGRWGPFPSSNNILLAYASHPLKRSSRTVRTALDALAKHQRANGSWGVSSYFFHTLHCLSQSTVPSAVEQFERAFKHLVETQNPDGTWGRGDWEWNTFLVLDSLSRRGYKTKRHALKRFYDIHRKDVLKGNRRAEAKRSVDRGLLLDE